MQWPNPARVWPAPTIVVHDNCTATPGTAVGRRVIVESANPRHSDVGYKANTTTTKNGGTNFTTIETARLSALAFWGRIWQQAASGNGSYQIEDVTNSVTWGSVVTVPQGTTMVVEGTAFSKHGSSTGTVEIQLQVTSGQSSKTIAKYGGGLLEEVLV
jgi:hypothetical protein